MSRPSTQTVHYMRSLYNTLPVRASRTSTYYISSTVRNASTTSPYPKGKPIPLEKPDKFRPPSHPSRLSRTRRSPAPVNYPGPPLSDAELAAQKIKHYPHTFPPQGSFSHWFINNKSLHLFITLGTLTVLGITSMFIHFKATSPYSHLLPSGWSLFYNPVRFFGELISTHRLHTDYITAEATKARAEKLADTQKRRLYRRAHGMEDLEAEEGQGVDVRGLVEWDDGLTRGEREAVLKRRAKEAAKVELIAEPTDATGEVVIPQERRKVKKWLGIWS